MPISRDRDCCGLIEISESSGRRQYFDLRQTFDHFLVWRAGTSSRYSTGESPHKKAGHREFLPHFESTCTRFNTSARRRTRPSAGHERSQQMQIPPSLNSKAILQLSDYFSSSANIGGRLVFLLRKPWRATSFSLASTLDTNIFLCTDFYHPPKILGVPMFFECAYVFAHIFRRLYLCILFCILI